MINKKFFQQALTGFGVAALIVPAMCFGADEKIVKIGLTSPLSGAQAAVGKDNENGAQMAIDKLNEQGVVIWGTKIKFELLSEDD